MSRFYFAKKLSNSVDNSIPRDMMYIVKGGIVWMLN